MTKLCWVIYREGNINLDEDNFLLHVVFNEFRAKDVIKEYRDANPNKHYNWEITTCDE